MDVPDSGSASSELRKRRRRELYQQTKEARNSRRRALYAKSKQQVAIPTNVSTEELEQRYDSGHLRLCGDSDIDNLTLQNCFDSETMMKQRKKKIACILSRVLLLQITNSQFRATTNVQLEDSTGMLNASAIGSPAEILLKSDAESLMNGSTSVIVNAEESMKCQEQIFYIKVTQLEPNAAEYKYEIVFVLDPSSTVADSQEGTSENDKDTNSACFLDKNHSDDENISPPAKRSLFHPPSEPLISITNPVPKYSETPKLVSTNDPVPKHPEKRKLE